MIPARLPAGWRGRAEARDLERHNLGLIWPAAAQQGLDRGLHVLTWEDSEKYFLKFLHCVDQLIIQYQGRQGAAECQYT